MPRTIEHIVSTHEHARALRTAGNNIWPHSVDVKSIVREDQSNTTAEAISSKARRVAALLRARLPTKFFDSTRDDYDFGFIDAVDAMESCTVEALAVDKQEADMDPKDMLNEWMTVVYDWADRNRVWMGV
jgi:hypothetical protein